METIKTQTLTPAETARVFALYIGQECTYPDTDGSAIKAILTGVSKSDGLETTYKRAKRSRGSFTRGDYLAFKENGNHHTNALHCKLFLTPLNSITDEDAVQVANWIYTETVSIEERLQTGKDYINYCFLGKGLSTGRTEKVNEFSDHVIITQVFQFLISKGYAVPLWFGVNHWANGKTAIELGIATQK